MATVLTQEMTKLQQIVRIYGMEYQAIEVHSSLHDFTVGKNPSANYDERSPLSKYMVPHRIQYSPEELQIGASPAHGLFCLLETKQSSLSFAESS